MTNPGLSAALFGSTIFVEIALAALATALAVKVLARFAAQLGLLDRGGGHGLHREPDGHARSLVGGLGLGIGLALHAALAPGGTPVRPWELAALFLALSVGLADDRAQAGLGARAKFGLQFLPALAFAWGTGEPGAGVFALWLLAGLAAQNLANTFDHADGVLLSCAALALAPARPVWGVALFVVLAFNLRPRGRAGVLLGDSGSHLIALMLLCEPRAWGAFFLPALDLVRVLIVRTRQQRHWWVGDRAHLAHRLAARGSGPGAVALMLTLAASPAIGASAFAQGTLPRCLGLLGSALAFAWLVRATPAVDGRGKALSETRSGLQPEAADRAP